MFVKSFGVPQVAGSVLVYALLVVPAMAGYYSPVAALVRLHRAVLMAWNY